MLGFTFSELIIGGVLLSIAVYIYLELIRDE
jgi:hypothetical protein